MRFTCIMIALLFTAGCAGGGVGSNQADFIKALAIDPASNCVVINTPYGGLLVARGTPGAEVTLAGGSCSIKSQAQPVGPVVTVPTDVRVPVTVRPDVTVGAPTIIAPLNAIPAPAR